MSGPFFESTARRSGRTTRMLEHVVAAVGREPTVLLVVASEKERQRIARRLLSLLDHAGLRLGRSQLGTVEAAGTRIFFQSIEDRRWHNGNPHGIRPSLEVWDHFAAELQFEADCRSIDRKLNLHAQACGWRSPQGIRIRITPNLADFLRDHQFRVRIERRNYESERAWRRRILRTALRLRDEAPW